MSLSLGGNRSRSSQTVDQTQTNRMSDRAAGLLTGQMNDLRGMQYNGVGNDDIARFQNPYQGQVTDATMAQLGQDRLVARNGLKSDMAGAGAFGDKRRGVMEAELEGQYDRTAAQTLAGLNSQGFNTALGAAQRDSDASNAYGLSIQQLMAMLAGGFANEGTSRVQGTTTGRNSNLGFGAGFTYGGG